MKNSNRFKMLSFFMIAAYLLAACGGTPQTVGSVQGPKVETNVVAFTGIVESIGGNEWTVSGQKVILDPQASLDPNIALGDEVKVKANVLSDGAIVVMKVESSRPDDVLFTPSVDPSGTPSAAASSTLMASSTSAVSTPVAPQRAGANENEVFGTLGAMTATTITVGGVTYTLTNATEFKDVLTVGDQVKLHVSQNADGSITVREVEKSVGSFDDNSSLSGSDDGPGHDANDDYSSGDSNDDSNGDDSNDDNGDHGGSDNSGSPNDD